METITTFRGWDDCLPTTVEEAAIVLCDRLTEVCGLTNLAYKVEGNVVTVGKFDVEPDVLILTGTGMFSGNILLHIDFGANQPMPDKIVLDTFRLQPQAIQEVKAHLAA